MKTLCDENDDTIQRVVQPHTAQIPDKSHIHALAEDLSEIVRRDTELPASAATIFRSSIALVKRTVQTLISSPGSIS